MTTLTLDTSGEIVLPYPNLHPHPRGIVWSDLSPFAQGYIEALLRSMPPFTDRGREYCVQFFRLHPETLAAILKDCETYRADTARSPMLRTGHEKKGRFFWEMRQQGHVPDFPPLTPYLDDTGKVRLREAGQ